jgi:hypothetical protein
MIRYYDIIKHYDNVKYLSNSINQLVVYKEHNSRSYHQETFFTPFNQEIFFTPFNKTISNNIINRKDVDISKMYASASEDLYNMLKSDDKEMVNMAFDFIFGQLGKEK